MDKKTIMVNKKTYYLTNEDIKYMVNRTVNRILNENIENESFLGINFGKNFKQENKYLLQKYAGLYSELYYKVVAIGEELKKRAEILDQIQNQNTNQPINEGGPSFVGTLFKTIGRFGLKKGTKAAYKLAGKQLSRRVGTITWGSLALSFSQVPEKLGRLVEKFKNPDEVQVSDIIVGYGDMAQWMQQKCAEVKEYPEILGAYALKNEIYSGPQNVENGPLMTAGEAAGAGVSLGLYALSPATFGISGIIAVLWDVIDVAAMLFSSKARSENEALKMVEKQYEYLNKAVIGFSEILAKTSESEIIKNTAKNHNTGHSYITHTGTTNTNINGKTYITGSDELDRPFMTNK